MNLTARRSTISSWTLPLTALTSAACSPTNATRSAENAESVQQDVSAISKVDVEQPIEASDVVKAGTVAAPAVASADQPTGAGKPIDPGAAAGYSSLRQDMVGIASIDGALVTAVTPKDECAATIETRGGPVRFNWKTSGDVNAYHEADQIIFPLQDSSGGKRLVSAPSGDAANGIMMTVGVFFGHCSEGKYD